MKDEEESNAGGDDMDDEMTRLDTLGVVTRKAAQSISQTGKAIGEKIKATKEKAIDSIIDAKSEARRFLNMDPSEDVSDAFSRKVSEESDFLSSSFHYQEEQPLKTRTLQRPTSRGRSSASPSSKRSPRNNLNTIPSKSTRHLVYTNNEVETMLTKLFEHSEIVFCVLSFISEVHINFAHVTNLEKLVYEYYYKMGYGVDVYNGLIEEVATQLHLEFAEALAVLNKMHFEKQLDIDGVRMTYVELRHENEDGTPEAYLKIVHSLMHELKLESMEHAMGLIQAIKYDDAKNIEKILDETVGIAGPERIKKYFDADTGYNVDEAIQLLKDAKLRDESEHIAFLQTQTKSLYGKYRMFLRDCRKQFNLKSNVEVVELLKTNEDVLTPAPDAHMLDSTRIKDLMFNARTVLSATKDNLFAGVDKVRKSFRDHRTFESGSEQSKFKKFMKDESKKFKFGNPASFLSNNLGMIQRTVQVNEQFSLDQMSKTAKKVVQEGPMGFPQLSVDSVKDFMKTTALRTMFDRFDVNKDGTVDRDEILGLVKMMVSGFITSFGISNINEDILQPYYDELIDGLLKHSNGDFLTFEDFNNFGFLMREFKKMIVEIDLAGLATKAMLDKIWEMNQGLLINGQFHVERCHELVSSQLMQTVNEPMLEKLGLSKNQFNHKVGDMTQVIIDIVDLNRDGFIDKEEFLLIGSLISKFSQLAGGGGMDISMIREIAGNSGLLESYWKAFDEDGDEEISREELQELLGDFIGKFTKAISVWTGEELPEDCTKGFVEDLTTRAFKLLDKDNSGYLSKAEFLQFDKVFHELKDFNLDVRNISLWVSQSMLDDLWNQYDEDGDGTLDRAEIKKMVKELLVQFHNQDMVTKNAPPHVLESQAEKLTKSLMDAVDEDKSGTLTKEEFQNLGTWLKSFMVDSEVNESLKTAMIDDLWKQFDDDDSGFLEKEEIKEVMHRMICQMPELESVFGTIERVDTEKYLDKLWKKCKEFDEDGNKQISKTEFTHFAEYINQSGGEIDTMKIKLIVQKRKRKLLWKTYIGKKEKQTDASKLHLIIEKCLENDDRHLPEEKISVIVRQCIKELSQTGDKNILTRKEFKGFPDWYMNLKIRADTTHLDLSTMSSNEIESMSSMPINKRQNSLDKQAKFAKRHRKSMEVIQALGEGVDSAVESFIPGTNPANAMAGMMESKAKEIWENQIDEKSAILVEHMVKYAEGQVDKMNDPDSPDEPETCGDMLCRSAMFIGTKIGVILGLVACLIVFPLLLAATAIFFVLSLITFFMVSDITCLFFTAVLLSFTIITVIRQLLVMILHVESGGIGLAFTVTNELFVSRWIHTFLNHLQENASWFDLDAFLFFIFDTIMSFITTDLKEHSVEDFVKYVVKDEAKKTFAALPGIQKGRTRMGSMDSFVHTTNDSRSMQRRYTAQGGLFSFNTNWNVLSSENSSMSKQESDDESCFKLTVDHTSTPIYGNDPQVTFDEEVKINTLQNAI